ncbi:MAG TPA: DUF177 domain-containing protein [Chthoniobacteraceae bacterium]|jgi:uncharacterized metal-binding protein YceD (DUF177 family)|nr:DUF177 domain-containing protein [Chthoniobacteraceae bacterium]
MKVHLNQIPPEGLHVEGEDSRKVLDLRDPGIQPVSDVHYALDIGLSDGGLFATGTIGIELECQCVSCLEQFELPLEVEDFACQTELTGSETVDLTEPIREDILLALPPHPHCDWNGERVCPGPARELRSEADNDPLPQESDVWGALDQLKIKKN